MEGVEGKISPGLEVVRKYLRKFRLYPGEIKMKKFCVLFVGIVILAIAGISAGYSFISDGRRACSPG